MKILHCFKVYLPDQTGGIEEAISWIAAGTPPADECSVLVCRKSGRGSKIVVNGIPVERTTTFGEINSVPVSPTYIWRLRQRARNADVLVFHAPFPLTDIGLLFGLRRDQALVIHWHADIVGRDWFKPVFGPLLDSSLKRADKVLVTTAPLIDSSPYLRRFREKCQVVPYGIDTKWWSDLSVQDHTTIDGLRQEHPRLIAACGRLVPYKGFDVLIRAMARVDAHLFIVGTGPLKTDLEALARSLGVADRVTFPGFMARVDQKRLLNSARVFVMSSTTEAETFEIAQLEGMCCGLPVVNTNLPTGVPHVARHEREGLTVEPGDPEALAAAISRLLDDADLAAHLGRAGQARARETYDWRTYAAACAQVYREALEERRRGTA